MNYLKKNMEIIDESIKSLDEEAFERLVKDCVSALKNGNRVIASGLGKNVPICEKFEGTLLSLGLNAFFLHTNSALHGDLGAVKDGDIVIVLTKSGSTEESIKLVKCLEKRNVKIWLLTFEKTGVLSERVENVLCMQLQHEGDKWNIMPNNSTTINLIVLQGVAMRIAEEMKLTLEDFKRNHPGGHIGEILEGK